MKRTDRPLEYPTLILGSTGAFGGAVAAEMLARGYPVRLMVRDPSRATRLFERQASLNIVRGDVLNPSDVARAAMGCGSIVHGVNFAYHEWDRHMIPATSNVIAAARKVRAQILFPSNVYGLGRQTGAPLPESARNSPCTKKGTLRVQIEEALEGSLHDGVPRVILVRAGDYFGPTVRNALVDDIFGNAARGNAMQIIGDLDIRHQWAYVPDVARVSVDLLELSGRLDRFELVHWAGTVLESQRAFLHAVARQSGKPGLGMISSPVWRWRALLGLFSPRLRELEELEYLYFDSVILADPRRLELLPTFQSTPLEMAIQRTLDSYRGQGA